MTDTTDPTKPVAWMRWNEAAATSTGVTDTEYYRDLWTSEGDTVVPLVRLSEYEEKKKTAAHLSLTLAKETARSEALEAENKRLREALDAEYRRSNEKVDELTASYEVLISERDAKIAILERRK